ncbi:MAG: CCC motif membrane protein [bacterium]|nr:CCC motif membrane protein [bacterium]
MNGTQQLPNSTAVLVLGILSIVFCLCYGVVGLTLGIIGLVLANKSLKLYTSSPNLYTTTSYKNLAAGRVCAIIGTCLSSIYILIIIIAIAYAGSMGAFNPMLNGLR